MGEKLAAAAALLNKRYLIGSVRGEGAFGITYLGFDTVLSHRVAVKRAFLKDGVTREEKHAECDADNGGAKNTFLEEAVMLAGKYDIPASVLSGTISVQMGRHISCRNICRAGH